MENICSAIFEFQFRKNPRFRDEFQALITHKFFEMVHAWVIWLLWKCTVAGRDSMQIL